MSVELYEFEMGLLIGDMVMSSISIKRSDLKRNFKNLMTRSSMLPILWFMSRLQELMIGISQRIITMRDKWQF